MFRRSVLVLSTCLALIIAGVAVWEVGMRVGAHLVHADDTVATAHAQDR